MATAVTCPECGADAPSGAARWCGSCGAALQASPGSTSRAEPAPTVLRVDSDDDVTVVLEEPPVPRGQRGFALLVIAAVVVGLLALQANSGEDGADRAFTPRGDAARTGVVSLEPLSAPTSIAWRATVNGNGGWTREHLAVHGTVVAVAGDAGVSLHRRSGELEWHRPDIVGAGTPAVSGDTLVVFDHASPSRERLRGAEIAERGRLRGLSLDDGATVWSTRLAFGPPELIDHPAGLIVRDGSRALALIDPATGQERWRVDAYGTLDASIREILRTSSRELLYVLATRPAGLDPRNAPPEAVTEHLVAVDAASGSIRFEVAPVLQAGAGNPFAVLGDTIVGMGTGSLLHWDADTGEQIDLVRHRIPVEMERLVGHDGLLVAVYDSGTVLALDPSDASRQWAVRNPVGAVDDAFVAGTSLLLRAGDRLGAVDLASGDTLETIELPLGAGVSPPDLDGSYATSGGGALVLRDSQHRVEARWPTIGPAWPAPTVRDGAVAVVTSQETALFDLGSGENRWRLATATAPRRTPPRSVGAAVITDDLLVFSPPRREAAGAQDGLAAVDLVQAVFRWDRSSDEPPPTGPVTLAGRTVFLPVGGELHGHAVETGRRSFAARAGHARGPIAAHPEYLIAASHPQAIVDDPRITPNLTAIRRLDRSNAWEQPLAACTPPVVSGDLVLAATVEGVSAHEIHRGGVEWFGRLPDPGCIELAVAKGTVVATTGRARLVAFSTSGEPLWNQPLGAAVTAPPTIAGDTILVPLRDGTIAGVELSTGEVDWRFDLGAVPVSPVTVHDGRLLVLTDAGELVAIGTD
ncbi:MAG: PQQ-binding-like beta-propeller repeat protein [Nitriliruptorales bacterium]|nr:PQQ-binding-like beta-propeller repeat protein [Nitriliruptorales bacterium]